MAVDGLNRLVQKTALQFETMSDELILLLHHSPRLLFIPKLRLLTPLLFSLMRNLFCLLLRVFIILRGRDVGAQLGHDVDEV